MAEERSRKGESAATLAAVVASLGTAVGVFTTDAGAAEFLKQPAAEELQQGAAQEKLKGATPQGKAAQQLKLKGAAQQHKLETPAAQQLKLHAPAAQQQKLKGPAAQQLKLNPADAAVNGDGKPAGSAAPGTAR